eukprot:TRINITY_DN15266_c0_g1_i1.p1 TRINITY_DN15266_c0_g1~~TRINITY_DN15266_c0_g1_i1.p1  ORF type:complete len:1254 (-),score=117.23 TRINITY_DN15266_c0_g1_i1:37-3798(-)
MRFGVGGAGHLCDAYGLSADQEAAAASLLRVSADGELSVEQARCRLCEVKDFDPTTAFRTLCGNWSATHQGWISVHDIYAWLGRQEHTAAGILLEEVAELLKPFLNAHGELRYDGFLRLVLPRDPAHAWLKEAALLRRSHPGNTKNTTAVSSDVSYRLCRLIEGERDIRARIEIQRRRLVELRPWRGQVVALLTAPGGPRHALVDRNKILDEQHCEALLRRIGMEFYAGGVVPSASAEEVIDFMLSPCPEQRRGGPVTSQSTHFRPADFDALSRSREGTLNIDRRPEWTRDGSATHQTGSFDSLGRSRDLVRSIDGPHAAHASPATRDGSIGRPHPALASPAARAAAESAAAARRAAADANIAGRSSSPSSPQAPIRCASGGQQGPGVRGVSQLGGPGGPGGPGAHSFPQWQAQELPSRYSPPRSHQDPPRYATHTGPVTDFALAAYQISPPPPPLSEPGRSGLYQPSKGGLSPRRASYVAEEPHFHGRSSPSSPSRQVSFRRPELRDPAAPPGRMEGRGNWAWWEEGPELRNLGPERERSPIGMVGRCSSPHGRPQSPKGMQLSPPPRSSPRPIQQNHGRPSDLLLCPQCGNVYMADAAFCRRCGLKREWAQAHKPAGSFDGASFRDSKARAQVEPDRPEPPRLVAPDGFYEGPLVAPTSGDSAEKRLLRTVLQAMVRQAGYDIEAEDAKHFLRPGSGGCGLPALYRCLDPMGKGYVLDTDLLQVFEDQATAPSFASLCSLINEANIRRGRGSAGQLSFRDVGQIVFPMESKEYKAMREAGSDNESKSILYLLLFSEACPRCGMRCQRQSDASGCPVVPCGYCKAPFRCYIIETASLDDGKQASAADRFSFCKVLAAAARTAENLELDRKRLAAQPGFNTTTLKEVFNYISRCQPSFDGNDLRHAFLDQNVAASEKELDLIWHRYAPGFGENVAFEDFAPHLAYEPLWTPEGTSATNRILKYVVQTAMRQAASDAATEDAKVLLPKDCPATALFNTLDDLRKGYIIDADLSKLIQAFRGETPFSSVCALIQEIQLRRCYSQQAYPGRLSFREFASLIFPIGSKEYEALRACVSDTDAKSILYLVQNSTLCPKCGYSLQRASDSRACPEVECANCRTTVTCLHVAGDKSSLRDGWSDESGATRLSVDARQTLHRFIVAAANSAEELEKDRIRLATLLGYDATALSDVFNFLAQGRSKFTLADLRRSLSYLEIRASERDLDLFWKRYAARGETAVTFNDFLRQLKPLTQGIGGP